MSSSMAMKALQAIQQPADDYWNFLELIEAPRWVDLTVEAVLEGTEGDHPWFYQHHVHHETPLEELALSPTMRASREADWDTRPLREENEDVTVDIPQGLKPEEAKVKSKAVTEEPPLSETKPNQVELNCSSLDSSTDTVEGHGEVKRTEKDQFWPGSKAKRIQLLPDRRIDGASKERTVVTTNTETASLLRPSNSFSTNLLSTLMARLRTSEEKRASLEEKPLVDSKLANQMKGCSPDSSMTFAQSQTRKNKMLRASIACVLPVDRKRGAISGALKGNKENTLTARKDKGKATTSPPQLIQQKKPRLINVRRSIPAAEYERTQLPTGTFSVGRSDVSGIIAPRHKACKSPNPRRMSQAARTLGLRERRKSVRISASLLPKVRHEPKPNVDTRHSSKLTPRYEPRLHSTRDIREWEKRSGLQYYSLQPLDRVRVNQEIGDYKKLQRR